MESTFPAPTRINFTQLSHNKSSDPKHVAKKYDSKNFANRKFSIKKKGKVRCRAMYCQFQLAQTTLVEEPTICENEVQQLTAQQHFHDAVSPILTLRGPPKIITS
jgi:hypothetical protein